MLTTPKRSIGNHSQQANALVSPQIRRENTTVNQTQNLKNRANTSRNLTVLALSCDLPAPSKPSGVTFTKDEAAHWRSIWRGPAGHYLDDSHAHEVAVYVKLTAAILSGSASAWQAQTREKLAIQFGFTPASLRNLGYVLDGAPV